ncbi:MAG TPA: transposase [Flavobacteriales bacterium]|nr:transposase [Flavobacteriales bacterium]
MSERYKFVEGHAHFITFAVVGWVDVFTRREYAEFLLKNLAFCRKNKGLRLYEFVIMPNHLHLIAAAANGNLGEVMCDFKTYTSKELVKLIEANPRESRKEWMLRVFREQGTANPQNVNHQFWQQSNRPIILDKPELFEQRRNYLRENPLRAGLVNDESAYVWSSANPYLDFKCDEA